MSSCTSEEEATARLGELFERLKAVNPELYKETMSFMGKTFVTPNEHEDATNDLMRRIKQACHFNTFELTVIELSILAC